MSKLVEVFLLPPFFSVQSSISPSLSLLSSVIAPHHQPLSLLGFLPLALKACHCVSMFKKKPVQYHILFIILMKWFSTDSGFCIPGNIWQCLEMVQIVITGEGDTAGTQRPVTKILQYIRQLPATKTCLASSVNIAEDKNPALLFSFPEKPDFSEELTVYVVSFSTSPFHTF